MEATRESIYQFLLYCDQHIQGKERADAQSFLNEFFYHPLLEPSKRINSFWTRR